jgi:hypothetical protein
MNRSYEFCDNIVLIKYTAGTCILSQVLHRAYHEKSEVFVLVPCYCVITRGRSMTYLQYT